MLILLLLAMQDVVDARRVYLGTPGDPEWEEFAGHEPHGRRLDVRFRAEPGPEERTLYVRQRDVKLRWVVELNGRALGELELMEHPLVRSLPVPPGALRVGENVLSFLPPDGRDDIVVGEIRLGRPPDADLDVEVLVDGAPGPCRIT
ncbi:MAG TPA: hypothetical protein VEJ18_03295, partial [Planctomycetota bacterium]|nr:hypothetical protein [Planctomycetota bacterium]